MDHEGKWKKHYIEEERNKTVPFITIHNLSTHGVPQGYVMAPLIFL